MFIHHLDCKSNFAYISANHKSFDDLIILNSFLAAATWVRSPRLAVVVSERVVVRLDIRVFQASSHIKDSFALIFVPTRDVILNLCCLVGFFLLLIFIIIHLRSEYFNTRGIIFGHAIGHVIWVLTDASERQSHSL